MPPDSPERPPWYRPPEQEAAPKPETWVRPAPVYYHEAPEAIETIEAPVPAQPAQPAPAQPTPDVPASPASAVPEIAAAPNAVSEVIRGTAPKPVPARGARRFRARAMAAVVLIAAVAAAGFFGGRQLFGWFRPAHVITVPGKVGGLDLLATSTVASKQALAAQGWTDAAGGAYGGGGVTQILLLVGRPPHAAAEGTAFTQGLASDLVQQGYVFNPATSTTAEGGGAAFICGPASAASGQLILCAWTDTDAAGIVLDYSGESIAQARALAVLARTASEH
jgi:hypothetical protein